VVADISTVMVKDKLAREPFQLRDIRRTCETMLAGMGISRDVRAQLLSHGISGVQHEHYDMYEYLDEKRVALNAWQSKLEEIATGKTVSNVVPLHA
jgi:integrase